MNCSAYGARKRRGSQATLACLSEVKAPVLLIWSDADPIGPLAVGRYLVAMLPRAELAVVPGADHMFARDRAEEIAPRSQRHLLAP